MVRLTIVAYNRLTVVCAMAWQHVASVPVFLPSLSHHRVQQARLMSALRAVAFLAKVLSSQPKVLLNSILIT